MMGSDVVNTTDCETFENTTCEFYGDCEYDDGSGEDEYDYGEYCEISECQ